MVDSDTFGDLVHLKVDEGISRVAVTVPLEQDGSGFFNTAVRDQPSWRLGDEPKDKDELNGGRETLESGWDSPGPGVVETEGTVGYPSGHDTSHVPSAILVRLVVE